MLHAFIEDNPTNLNVPGEMDKFLVGLTHCAALSFDCRNDRKSGDPESVRKYTQGQIVTTLRTLLQIHRLSSTPCPTPTPALLPTGRALSVKPSSFGRQRPASVNSVQVAFDDGSSFDIPPDAGADNEYIAQRYVKLLA